VNLTCQPVDVQNVDWKAPALAFRARAVKVAQELHLDLFEAGAATALAPAAAGVKEKALR